MPFVSLSLSLIEIAAVLANNPNWKGTTFLKATVHTLLMDLVSESIIDRRLFEEVKDVAWITRIYSTVNGSRWIQEGTGFSVSDNGVIMTCDHGFPYPDNFYRDAEVKLRRSAWDVAILELISPVSCKCGVLASDGSLYAGQPLGHLGNPYGYYGSFMTGRASYPCVNVKLPTVIQTCRTYISSASRITPEYPILGHHCNSLIFKEHPGISDHMKDLDPMVPIIIFSGLTINNGCSGGPLFKSDGTIIGMVNTEGSAIHVSALEECYRQFTSLKVETSQHI